MLSDGKTATIMLYSEEELAKFKKIQAYHAKKLYKYAMSIKLMKSGLAFELQASKIAANSMKFLITDCQTSKTSVFRVKTSEIPLKLKSGDEQTAINHVLENLRLSKKSLVYEFSAESVAKVKVAEFRVFLVNFEKELVISFFFEEKEKRLCAQIFENREQILEFFVKNAKNSAKTELQRVCEGLSSEIVVVFSEGLPKCLVSRDFPQNSAIKLVNLESSFEVLAEKSENRKDLAVVSRIFRAEAGVFLVNSNRKSKESGVVLQETVFLGKGEGLSEIIERFQRISLRKLLYEDEFYGVEETELTQMQQSVSFSNDFAEVSQKNLENDKELNEAAIKIQKQYKKKKIRSKKNEISLKSIKEVNETKGSNENFLEESFHKRGDQLKDDHDDVKNMVFDEEMDEAAAKIQKHYRNKKKNQGFFEVLSGFY